MKILLLGASGQLGREWQAFFSVCKANDLVIVPYTSDQLDITRYEEVEHELMEHQPDIIINCAACTNVDKAEEEREKAQLVNADAVDNLAKLCRKMKIKLVHFSTDYIFAGDKEDQKKFPEGYPENHTANPVNWYGQTKWDGEEAIRRSGCNHLIIRVSWLCGAYGNNFVTTMLRLADENDELDVVNDQWGSPTFTENVVENTFKLIEQKREGTYHLASEGIINWAEFAEAIFDIAQKKVNVHGIPSSEYPTIASRPFYSKLDTDKIKHVKGIKIEGWKEGLQRILKKITL